MDTTIRLTGGCLGDETLAVRCDLTQAASPVEVCYDGENWEPTQYQCADTRHTNRGLKEIAQALAAAACEVPAAEAEECEEVDEPLVAIEAAEADETIRICGGLEDFAGLEHPAIGAACEAYHAAACDALRADPRAGRLFACTPIGQRRLHSAWAGAKFAYQCGALATMATLTEDEKAAVSAADDAGREAAKKVIEAADAVA